MLMLAAHFPGGCATPSKEQLGVRPDATPVHHQAAFSPDGKYVAATKAMANSVLVFDPATGFETLRFQPEELRRGT